MPVPNYGALVGTIIDKLDSRAAMKKNPGSKPHYQILVEANNIKYRIAVNVKSDQQPSDLQFLLKDNYNHPVLNHLKNLPVGFTPLSPQPDTAALDFIRGNLFNFKDMQIVPSLLDGNNNDLNDIFNVYVQRAIDTPGSLVYALGDRWGPEINKKDAYFDFEPGNGIHDIHMNQGNSGSHKSDNGVYRDGALFLFFPDRQQWTAMFLKFQSQAEHTDDTTGNPIEAAPSDPTVPQEETTVKIFAAMVNPKADDRGKEFVYLVNTTDTDIDLTGWIIADKLKKKEVIGTIVLEASGVIRVNLSGQNAQLSDNGGIITLLNKDGIKVDGVSYTKDEAANKGKLTTF
jgi:uncharacterized protein YukJ